MLLPTPPLLRCRSTDGLGTFPLLLLRLLLLLLLPPVLLWLLFQPLALPAAVLLGPPLPLLWGFADGCRCDEGYALPESPLPWRRTTLPWGGRCAALKILALE